jgi:hypothetical protein
MRSSFDRDHLHTISALQKQFDSHIVRMRDESVENSLRAFEASSVLVLTREEQRLQRLLKGLRRRLHARNESVHAALLAEHMKLHSVMTHGPGLTYVSSDPPPRSPSPPTASPLTLGVASAIEVWTSSLAEHLAVLLHTSVPSPPSA